MAATPSVFILIFYFCFLHLKWLLHIYFPNWFTHSKEGSMGRLKNEQNIWLCCFNYRDKQRYMNSSDPGQCHLPLIFVLSYLGWGRQGQAARLWVLCKHGPLSEILFNDKLIKVYRWFWNKSLKPEIEKFLRDEPEASAQVFIIKPMVFSGCSISWE